MSSSSSSSRHNHHHHHHRQQYDEKDLSMNETNGQMATGENILHVKFLLPGTTTGSVIGKGGERIASLQKETNTKMKMSKAGDYFPGTQERVCLVVGTIPNVIAVYEFIADKIKESFPGDVLRSRQVKLVIPNATAGVIIGKGGSTIETIKQDTGASLTITPKCDMAERVMTIIGEDPIRTKALDVVLQKILQDPHHDSVPSVNYSNGTSSSSSMTNAYAQSTLPNDLESFTGRGINAKMNALMSVPPSSNGSTSNNSLSNMSMQLSGLHRLAQLIIGAGGTNHMTVDSLTHSLASLGFPDPHTTEIVQAIGALINYGLIMIQTPLSVPSSSPSISGNNLFASAPLLSPPPPPPPHHHYSHHHHSMFAPPTNYTLSSSQRDRQDGYSTSGGSSSDMDYKRFKSDQQRSNKTKR